MARDHINQPIRKAKDLTADLLRSLRGYGVTIPDIATRYGISTSLVNKRLRKAGISKRRTPKPVIKVRKARQEVRDVAPRAGAHNPFGLGVAR